MTLTLIKLLTGKKPEWVLLDYDQKLFGNNRWNQGERLVSQQQQWQLKFLLFKVKEMLGCNLLND